MSATFNHANEPGEVLFEAREAESIRDEFPSPGANRNGQRPRVLFLNRSFWPDGEATGQLLTELTEDLESQFDVTVIAGWPNVNVSGTPFRRFRAQVRNGVRIVRVPHAQLPKQSLLCRAINLATFFCGAVVRGLLIRRHEIVVVETDPFLLALAGGILRWRHGARLVIYVQDIHPDLGVAIGRLKEGMLTRFLGAALRRAYRNADRVVVLSEDMRRTLTSEGLPEKLCVKIPNWIDMRGFPADIGGNGADRSANAFRAREGIDPARFLVMYSGNLGTTQLLEVFLDAAGMLQDRPDVLFALVGAGSGERGLRARAKQRRLENVRFFPYQPKDLLQDSLTAANLHFLSAHPNALGYLMPSKFYGILAAGRPVLAAVQRNSELARLIETENVGAVVPPDDAEAIASAITKAAAAPDRLAQQGRRARGLAQTRYDRHVLTDRFGCLLGDLASGKARAVSREVA